MKKIMVYFCIATALLILSGCVDVTSTANLLIFNEAEYILAVSPVLPEGEFHELTVDGVHSVFSRFMYFADLSLSANSFVRSDGYLLGLTAGDASERISIGFGLWHGLNMFADGFDEPVIVSDVHGIPVRAFIVDNDGARDIFFQATFRLDDIPYMVIHQNPNEAEGKKRVTEVVTALILYRPILEIFSYRVVTMVNDDSSTAAQTYDTLNYETFLGLLEANGFEFESGNLYDRGLPTGRGSIYIGDERLIVATGFPFQADPLAGPVVEITWAPEYMWPGRDSFAIVYSGDDSGIITFLNKIFGERTWGK